MLGQMALVNERFMARHPVPGDSIRANRVLPSNIWTRSVYMEGLLALNEVSPQPRYVDYAMDWAVSHLWGFRGGSHTRNANDQCCAQVYVDLYRMHRDARVLGNTERMVNNVVNSTEREDWKWAGALHMAMPVYAKMGVVKQDIRYFRTMKELYAYARDGVGQIGLFNTVEGLWWNGEDFFPPYKEPNGKNCYWSRVKKRLTADFQTLAYAVKKCQREDGFWNRSLMDEHHYGGKESTGTSLFVYGIAYGIRKGLLSPKAFAPIVEKAWNALCEDAVHPDGFLGYVQSTGKEPKDGHPVTYDSQPDFEDFGVGCFLLAGSEMAKLTER